MTSAFSGMFDGHLNRKLLRAGGHEVIDPGYEPDEALLLAYGRLLRAPVTAMGRGSDCHDVAAALFLHGKVERLAVGYALTDGGWVQHTWGVRADGSFVEPTEHRRELYWGVILTPAQSHARAADQATNWGRGSGPAYWLREAGFLR